MKDCYGNYFIITVLIVAFMLLYLYMDYYPIENFFDSFIPADKLSVSQGMAVPDENPSPIQVDDGDPTLMTVDGTDKAPKSLFMFTYNNKDIKCCKDSPYSTNGGCVCMTKEQNSFITSRGKNNRQSPCAYNEKDY